MSSTYASFIPMVAGTAEPVRLSMQRLWLTGQVLAAGARLIVQHVFRSEEQKHIEVIYSFPLPRDAAMRRFRITGDGFESYSELIETEAAIKAYEEGIAQGSLSALARQYGDGIVNLTVGNVRPGETVTVCLEILAGVELKDDGFRFRFPFTLAPCYHAKARVAMISPGEAEMELPTAEFGDLILPRFRDDATALHQIGFELSLSGVTGRLLPRCDHRPVHLLTGVTPPVSTVSPLLAICTMPDQAQAGTTTSIRMSEAAGGCRFDIDRMAVARKIHCHQPVTIGKVGLRLVNHLVICIY